jgi:hypothetical protein
VFSAPLYKKILQRRTGTSRTEECEKNSSFLILLGLGYFTLELRFMKSTKFVKVLIPLEGTLKKVIILGQYVLSPFVVSHDP